MDEAKLQVLKNKVVRGSLVLTFRTFFLQLITFVATFILTILLTPSVFGIFFVVSAVISFLTYFSDIGLAAALIQKKEEPDRTELVSVFTLQQIIVVSIVVIVFFLSGKIAGFYNLDRDGIFLLKSLLISFFLASLKTIPSILLERRLEFSRLVLPQILENIAFYSVAIVLALYNLGVASFAWAALIRGITGALAIYIVSPWLPGVGFSYRSIRKLITFGIPFQTNSILALIKDDLLTLYLGKVLPFSSLGLLGWAKKWAEVPLRLIMDSVIRVTFPVYARIQHDKNYLTKALDKTILFLAVFILPVSFLLIIYIKPMIFIIPKYFKWLPAVPAFYLFAVSGILSAFSTPLVNALNALGKIKNTLILMIFWTLATWILVPLLTLLFGFIGWPTSVLIISAFIFFPIYMLKKFVPFRFLANISKPLIISAAMSVFSYFTLPIARNILNLCVLVLISLLIYAVLIFIFLKAEFRSLLPALLKKK